MSEVNEKTKNIVSKTDYLSSLCVKLLNDFTHWVK